MHVFNANCVFATAKKHYLDTLFTLLPLGNKITYPLHQFAWGYSDMHFFISCGGFVTARGIVSVIHSCKTLHRTFFSWPVSSFEELRGVRVQVHRERVNDCKKCTKCYIGSVSIIAREDLSNVTSGACQQLQAKIYRALHRKRAND